MARTLKSAAAAFPNSSVTALLGVIGVEDDNATIKEFVNGWTSGSGLTLGAGIGVSSGTWNSNDAPYLSFVSGMTGYITIGSPISWANANASALVAVSYSAQTDNQCRLMANPLGAASGVARANTAGAYRGGYLGTYGTTSVPGDGTKVVFGGSKINTPSEHKVYYGVEGGSIALETSVAYTPGSSGTWSGVNVSVGYSTNPGHLYLAILVTGILHIADIQSFLDDPYGTVFEGASSQSPVPIILQMHGA